MSDAQAREAEQKKSAFDKIQLDDGRQHSTIPDKMFDVMKNVPEIDDTYHFDHDTTLAILAGFAFNRRVMVQGFHGTGKSTHIEQIAARLNWPCVRVNLD